MRVALANAAATLFGASVSRYCGQDCAVGQALNVLVQQNATPRRILPWFATCRHRAIGGITEPCANSMRSTSTESLRSVAANARPSVDLLSLLLQARDEQNGKAT